MQELRQAASHDGIRIVIFGEHRPWRDALNPDAPVWNDIGSVEEVVVVPCGESVIPAPRRATIRSIVIPLTEDASRRRPKDLPSLAPSRRAIDIFGNKAAFATYAAENDLEHHCPKVFASVDDAEFPCVVKRVDLNGGNGVAVARSRDELDALLEREPWRGHPVLLQALVPGTTDFVTHCVCKNGRIVWHCSFSYPLRTADEIREGPVHTPMARDTVASPATLFLIERFLAPLGYNGPCNVDYKISDKGGVTIFEINPRFGGSLMMMHNVANLRDALAHIIDGALN